MNTQTPMEVLQEMIAMDFYTLELKQKHEFDINNKDYKDLWLKYKSKLTYIQSKGFNMEKRFVIQIIDFVKRIYELENDSMSSDEILTLFMEGE